MSRCTVIIPDAGPLNSLWVADRLDLLLRLDMRLIVIDAVYDELTSDPSYPKDRDVKAFIDGNRPPFVIETTEIGRLEREKRASGLKLRRNAGELAIVDFMSSEDGLPKYVAVGDPVAILFEVDQAALGFLVAAELKPDGPAEPGRIAVTFYRRNGSVIDTLDIALDWALQGYGFRRAGNIADIAGVAITNRDPAGIGIDDIIFDYGRMTGALDMRAGSVF